jgi:hypothetical protein
VTILAREVSFDDETMKAQVTLYSKPGCHLCEEMKSEIARANCSDLYDLQEVNIESDAGLFARYRFDIPSSSLTMSRCFDIGFLLRISRIVLVVSADKNEATESTLTCHGHRNLSRPAPSKNFINSVQKFVLTATAFAVKVRAACNDLYSSVFET